MPLDDALTFVSRNYAEYLKEKELKAATAAPAPSKPGRDPDFSPPDKQTSYLFNLLADNRFLTVDELDNVIDYLTSRRDRLAEQTGAPARKLSKLPWIPYSLHKLLVELWDCSVSFCYCTYEI